MDPPINSQDRFLLNPLPTLTQLSRIRYTIDVLSQQQICLAQRLEEITPSSNLSLVQSHHLHASDIVAGWQDVQRWVDGLPTDGFERLEFQDEIDQGVAGSQVIIDRCSPNKTQ